MAGIYFQKGPDHFFFFLKHIFTLFLKIRILIKFMSV